MLQPEYKKKAQRRLKIIQGQVTGIQKLVDEERYCIDILTQIASVQEALRGVAKQVVRNHLETCVATAIREDRADEHYDELTNIMFKLSK